MAFPVYNSGIWDDARKIYRTFGGKWYRPGVSDILGVWRGWPLAIETKIDGAYATPEQRSFQAEWTAKGGIAFIARSIYDCKRELDAFDAKLKEKGLLNETSDVHREWQAERAAGDRPKRRSKADRSQRSLFPDHEGSS